MERDMNVVAYGRNLFGFDDNNFNQEKLQEMQASGFGTVILWPLHIAKDGSFFYHDSDERDPLDPIVQNGVFNQTVYGYMPPLMAALKKGGTVKRVLFAIGGAGPGDFDSAQALLATPAGTQTLLNNFQAVIKALSLDGFDFDLEVPNLDYDPYLDTVVALTLMLSQQCGVMVTYCPYTAQEFWVDCLAAVFQKNNQQQAVSWFGNLNINGFDLWVNEISKRAPLGINNVFSFIVPIYWSLTILTQCRPDSVSGLRKGVKCPCEVKGTLEILREFHININSGGIWNSAMIEACANSGKCGDEAITLKSYADALIAALNS
jgi:Glycosyl hydrolases family 18